MMSQGAFVFAALPPAALLLAVIGGSYFVGAIPFGYLAGRSRGVDIREVGSGNIGATNILRNFGKPLGILVFVLDFLKGLAPVLVSLQFVDRSHTLLAYLPLFATVGAILGHNYTCWLQFKGGKGIATSAGALIGLLPWAFLIAVLVWAITFFTSRYVALASILAALSLPFTVAAQIFAFRSGHSLVYLGFAVFLACLAVWRHRSNITRLVNGTEHRFGASPKADTSRPEDKGENKDSSEDAPAP